jgi:hypothetical protein
MRRLMRRRAPHIASVATLCLLAAVRAQAAQWDVSLDLRLVAADAPTSFQDGGLGILRYGDNRDGLQLGRARLALAQDLGEYLTFKVDASAWGQHDRNPVDVTEAYLQLHPYPMGDWRVRVKLGAFYAPISLENRADGWESPYTLSSSAMNSWVAQELRTIGTEFKLEWLGTHSGHDFDAGAAFGVYGWNQGAGTALANSGFTISDWQGSLSGRVGLSSGLNGSINEYHQYDSHAGTYLGLDVHYLDRITLEGLHYDNRADPAAEDEVTDEYAWHTQFNTAGVRAENDSGWTAIVQWMAGRTAVDPEEFGFLRWDFVTRYLLLSKRSGASTFSARYDDFKVDAAQSFPEGDQAGHALTLAYRLEPDTHWRFTLEWVRTRGLQENGALFADAAPFATQSAVQLAIRYALSSH